MIGAALSHFIQHTNPCESNFSDSFQLFLSATNYSKLLLTISIMKFLQAVVLSVICVGYVSASDPDYVGYFDFRCAIDKGRLDIAVGLVKQDETLGAWGVGHMVRKHSGPDFIANFVNQTNQANAHTLDEIWRKSPIETFEQVLEKVDFPQQVFVDFAATYNMVVSILRRFLCCLAR